MKGEIVHKARERKRGRVFWVMVIGQENTRLIRHKIFCVRECSEKIGRPERAETVIGGEKISERPGLAETKDRGGDTDGGGGRATDKVEGGENAADTVPPRD